jgi:hypothetical protein
MSARDDYPHANGRVFHDTEDPELSREIAAMLDEIDRRRAEVAELRRITELDPWVRFWNVS